MRHTFLEADSVAEVGVGQGMSFLDVCHISSTCCVGEARGG